MSQAKRKTATTKTTSAVTFFHPDEMPDEYAFRVAGDCMEPGIGNGDAVLCNRTHSVNQGDLAILYLKPEFVGTDSRTNAFLKRVVMNMMPGVTFPYKAHPDSNVMPVIIVEQDKPYRQYAIRADQLLGIHRCLGHVPEGVQLIETPATAAAGDMHITRRQALSTIGAAGAAAAVVAVPAVAGCTPAVALEEPLRDETAVAINNSFRRLAALMPPGFTMLVNHKEGDFWYTATSLLTPEKIAALEEKLIFAIPRDAVLPPAATVHSESRIPALFREWYRLMVEAHPASEEVCNALCEQAWAIETEILSIPPVTAQDLAMQIIATTGDGDFMLSDDFMDATVRRLCGVQPIPRGLTGAAS